jgi:ornithine--oxo-acid transaminase
MAPIAVDQSTPNGGASSNGTAAASRFHASSTQEAIDLEHTHAAHNYHPLPVVFSSASGCVVKDPEGREYLDFLSAYSAVNQGHCHPELIRVLTEQASRLTLSSRAFYNDVFPRFAEKVTSTFGYGMVLPMNTGAEAVETAVKVARKWAYKVKGVPANEAIVFAVSENFHGRTVSFWFYLFCFYVFIYGCRGSWGFR